MYIYICVYHIIYIHAYIYNIYMQITLVLLMIYMRIQNHGNICSFAARTSSGAVVAWGDPASGGDASAVAERLVSGVTVYMCTKQAMGSFRS